MYPIIEIFGRSFGTYGIFAIIGGFVAVFVSTRRAKKLGIRFEDMVDYYLLAALGVMIGGHLLYALVNFDLTVKAFYTVFRHDSVKVIFEAFSMAFGGAVFYGGLFGSAIVLFLSLRKKEQGERESVFGIYSLAVPLFHAFGRLGCFFGGCCYGIESEFGFIVEKNPFSPEICGVRRFPVALLECSVNILLYLFLSVVFSRKKITGEVFLWYGMTYSVARFFIEFLRGDKNRGIILNLSFSQWISIAFFLFCFAAFMIKTKKKKNECT